MAGIRNFSQLVRVFTAFPLKNRKGNISGRAPKKAQFTPVRRWAAAHARSDADATYRSPGFESDILRGNSLPLRAATSRIIAYRLVANGHSYTLPMHIHTLGYCNTSIVKSQRFWQKNFGEIAKNFCADFDHYIGCFLHLLAQNVGAVSPRHVGVALRGDPKSRQSSVVSRQRRGEKHYI